MFGVQMYTIDRKDIPIHNTGLRFTCKVTVISNRYPVIFNH